jgi:O-antigen ligase
MWSGDKRKRMHRQIFFWLVLLLVFFIPLYGKILPPLIILLSLNWLFEGSYMKTVPVLLRDKDRLGLLAFAGFYMLYLAGLLWSSDLRYAGFDLEVKLSLLLFPLIFATSEPFLIKPERFNLLLGSFLAGCILATLILYGHGMSQAFAGNVTGAFYYEELSWYQSPAYLAMYHSFAIAVAAWWLLKGYSIFSRFQRFATVLLMIYMAVFIILLNSKSGILTLGILVLVFSGNLILVRRKWITGMVVLVVSAALIAGIMALFPAAGKRITQAREDLKRSSQNAGELKSTAKRVAIWKCSLEIIGAHPVFGVGTGDVRDALTEKYKSYQMTQALEEKMNAHNQYLQTFMALGLVGGAVLIAILFFPMIRALRRSDLIGFVFLLIFAVNMLFESMLERQGGIIYYALFNALLFVACRKDNFYNPFHSGMRMKS